MLKKKLLSDAKVKGKVKKVLAGEEAKEVLSTTRDSVSRQQPTTTSALDGKSEQDKAVGRIGEKLGRLLFPELFQKLDEASEIPPDRHIGENFYHNFPDRSFEELPPGGPKEAAHDEDEDTTEGRSSEEKHRRRTWFIVLFVLVLAIGGCILGGVFLGVHLHKSAGAEDGEQQDDLDQTLTRLKDTNLQYDVYGAEDRIRALQRIVQVREPRSCRSRLKLARCEQLRLFEVKTRPLGSYAYSRLKLALLGSYAYSRLKLAPLGSNLEKEMKPP